MPVPTLWMALMMALVVHAAGTNKCTRATECLNQKQLVVMEDGHMRDVVVLWRGEAELYAAALLLHKVSKLYCRLMLCEAPKGACDWYKKPPTNLEHAVVLGFELLSQLPCATENELGSRSRWLRKMLNVKSAPLLPRLHARLPKNKTICLAAGVSRFYDDLTMRANCDFSQSSLEVRVPSEWGTLHDIKLAALGTTELTQVNVPRTTLEADVHSANTSFLFADVELWSNESNVVIVRDAVIDARSLATSSEANALVLVSQMQWLKSYAPWIIEMLDGYVVPRDHLADLLKLDIVANGENALNATRDYKTTACTTCMIPVYILSVYRCAGDAAEWAQGNYSDFLFTLRHTLNDETRCFNISFNINYGNDIDCSSDKDLQDTLITKVSSIEGDRFVGAVIQGVGVVAAADTMKRQEGAILVSYDTQHDAFGVGARSTQLEEALNKTLGTCGWQRAVVLWDDHFSTLGSAEDSKLLRVKLPPKDDELKALIRSLHEADIRIFVIDAHGLVVKRVLAVVVNMTLTKECVWLAREWTSASWPPVQLLALRTAPRRASNTGLSAKILNKIWNSTWPARAAPLADAVLTLGLGFAQFVKHFPNNSFDLFRVTTKIEKFRTVLKNGSLNMTESLTCGQKHNQLGATRHLTYDQLGATPYALRLELWMTNNTIKDFDIGDKNICPVPAVPDGTFNCTYRNGNDFKAPRFCLDLLVVFGVIGLLLLLMVGAYCVAGVYRSRRARYAKLQSRMRSEACAALLARQADTVPALAPYLVERSRVHLLYSLGAGRHGHVWLASLQPGGSTVAAKTPHAGCSPAEESELLREAAIMAPLRHPRVLRLIGVCVDAGPALLLTEPAHNGDLLTYLRERRPRGYDTSVKDVAPPELTRFAHEAALALAYLAVQGLVHCDVRAANFLVDETRSLKLGDFGMARRVHATKVETGTVGTGEYACRRRALFPVLWMAPESLVQGLFSAASDVWALGVLVLELVTLGARPFGSMGAREAVALVSRGGHARLPVACSAETRALARACWRVEPAARPTAHEVAEWLEARPKALEPTPTMEDANDSDSGFGEPPSTPALETLVSN